MIRRFYQVVPKPRSLLRDLVTFPLRTVRRSSQHPWMRIAQLEEAWQSLTSGLSPSAVTSWNAAPSKQRRGGRARQQ